MYDLEFYSANLKLLALIAARSNVKVSEQPDFLDAKLVTAYFANGVAPLRPDVAVSIKNV